MDIIAIIGNMRKIIKINAMKKSLFFLLLSVFGFAQNITLKTTDSIRFRKQVEELAKATGKDYIFKEDTFDRQLGTYIEYHNPQDLNDRLIFFYFVFNDGENKELDNKGVTGDFSPCAGVPVAGVRRRGLCMLALSLFSRLLISISPQ